VGSNQLPPKTQTHVPTSVIYEAGRVPQIEYRSLELHVVEGADQGASHVVQGPVVVGTAPETDLRLTDRAVSRRHLELRPAGDGLWLRDLDSTNGTFLRGSKVREAVLQPGESFEVGRTRVEVRTSTSRRRVALSKRDRFGGLVGESAAMKRLYSLLERVCPTDVTVLIEGETGTGKELAARALHDGGNRAAGPFVVVDCSAVSPTLIEAELFGHAKGAFTNADRDRQGAFETAQQGTIFLDEVGELPLELQPKLLRVLQEREVRRIGEQTIRHVDVRVIAATNRDLPEEVAKGRFREDLYYRLAVFRVRMPALRERTEDIPLLVRHFIGDRPGTAISDETMRKLKGAPWPGNVRELHNTVERALLLSFEEIESSSPRAPSTAPAIDASRPFKEVKNEVVDGFERSYIERLMERAKGNVSRAAREAGIDRKHLERLLKKHHLR
jgi:DNA-binding NtrC family response regulator